MTDAGPRPFPSLTATGRGVVAATLMLGPLGWSLGYVAVTAVAGAAVLCLVSGWLYASRAPRLAIDRTIEPTRVERGSPALGLLSVRNAAPRRSRPCEAIEPIVPATEPTDRRDVVIAIPALRVGRVVSLPYRLPTHRRGALHVGPLSIERRDPLGLWHAHRPLGGAVTLLVQPHVIPIDPRPAGRARHLDGPVSESSPRGTQMFHSLREYVPGDDVRRIHWRSTARVGSLMVQEHVDTSQPSTVVVLDLRADRYGDDRFEEAVDVAASIVAASQRSGFPVRLVTTVGRSLNVRAGQRGAILSDYLTEVAALDTAAEPGDLRRAAIEVLRSREHDALTVVSGELAAADLAAVGSMARRFASPVLVTVRSRPGERWLGGRHLDGPTAVDALARWHAPARRGSPVAAPATVGAP